MADLEDKQAVAAGWYADYTGEQRMRWWDGTQWTEHVSAVGLAAHTTTPARNTVAATTPAGTIFFWILVLLPVISTLLSLGVDYGSLALQSTSRPSSPFALYSDPWYLALAISGWVILAASVVLAYLDFRTLRARGFERPFHWAWAFLTTVYIIGRTVVVFRRSGRGLAPFFAWLAVAVISVVITIAHVASAASVVLNNIPGSVTNT